jgi:hypothetical protein
LQFKWWAFHAPSPPYKKSYSSFNFCYFLPCVFCNLYSLKNGPELLTHIDFKGHSSRIFWITLAGKCMYYPGFSYIKLFIWLECVVPWSLVRKEKKTCRN